MTATYMQTWYSIKEKENQLEYSSEKEENDGGREREREWKKEFIYKTIPISYGANEASSAIEHNQMMAIPIIKIII